MQESIGYVLGTQEATPLEFWVAVSPGCVLRLDDVLQVQTQRPDGKGAVQFYGIVDFVRTQYEGAQFDTDTFLATQGKMPVNVSYAAHVQVTRIEPEEYLPPQPGDRAYLAVGQPLRCALYFDRMRLPLPAGLMSNGSPAYLNFAFFNGEQAAHVNISGISGVATKTSYALFLLYSIFNSNSLGAHKANTKALIFNVKGEDLFFLDKPNKRYASENLREAGKDFDRMQLPVGPFASVSFRAAPKKYKQEIVPDLEQRSEGISTYLWSLREVCRDRLFRFLFTGDDLERGNLSFLVASVEEKLARIAAENDRSDPRNRAKAHLEVEPFGEESQTKILSFKDLLAFLEDKLLTYPDPKWLERKQHGHGRSDDATLVGHSLPGGGFDSWRSQPDGTEKIPTRSPDGKRPVGDRGHPQTGRAGATICGGRFVAKAIFTKGKTGARNQLCSSCWTN